MRVIAGEWKGRRLESPDDRTIRPTSDKVKEAVFSLIAPWVDQATVVDLFCGTGGLGLEALSRGAAMAYFGDCSRRSLALTEANVRRCRAEERARLIAGDWRSVLERIDRAADIILLDPPYETNLIPACLAFIAERDRLGDEGIVVTEHPAALRDLNVVGWNIFKQRRYGDTGVTIYTRQTEE